MQQGSIALRQRLPFVLSDFSAIRSKISFQRVQSRRSLDEKLPDVLNIATVGPPSGPEFFEHGPYIVFRMGAGEDGLARSQVVVKLRRHVERVVRKQKHIIRV